MRRESIILNEDGFKSVDGGSDPEAIEEVDEDSDTETRYAQSMVGPDNSRPFNIPEETKRKQSKKEKTP